MSFDFSGLPFYKVVGMVDNLKASVLNVIMMSQVGGESSRRPYPGIKMQHLLGLHG